MAADAAERRSSPSAALRLLVAPAVLLGGIAAGVVVAQPEWGLVVFGAAALVVLLSVTLRRPWVAGVALVVAVFTDASSVAEARYGLPSALQALIVVAFAAVVLRAAAGRQAGTGTAPACLLLLVYLVAMTASVLTAQQPEVAVATIAEYVKAGAVGVLVVALVNNAAQLRRVVWGIVAAGLGLAAVNVFQYVTGSFDRAYLGFAEARVVQIAGVVDDARLSGPVGDPNFFAQLMVVIVPLAADRVLREQRRVLRVVAGAAAGLAAATVVLTYSRGGLLSLLVVAGLLMMLYRSRRVVLVAAVGLGVLVLVTAALQSAYLTRLAAVGPFQGPVIGEPLDPSLQGRASEAYVAIEMFRDNPLLGIGVGGYPGAYQRYVQELGTDPRVEPRESHSLFLEVVAEGGLVGLAALVLVLAVAGRTAWRARGRLLTAGHRDEAGLVEGLLLATAGYLTAAIFLHPYQLRVQLVLLALLVATGPLADRQIARAGAQRPPTSCPPTSSAPTSTSARS